MGDAPAEHGSDRAHPLDRPLVVLATHQPWAADLLRQALAPEVAHLEVIPRDAHAGERIARFAPTVAAVELSEPGAQGFELLRALAARPETREIPAIGMASLPDPLIRTAAFAAGAEDFLSRLSDPAEVRARVGTLTKLGMARVRERLAEAEIAALQKRLHERAHSLTDSQRLVDHLQKSLVVDGQLHRSRVDGLVAVGIELNKVQDFHLLMDRILSEARALIGADAGTIFISENNVLRFAYTQNDTLTRRAPRGEAPRFSSFLLPASASSIAGWVGVSGESINIADAYALPPESPFQFDASFDRLTGYRTQSVLALPLRTSLGRTVGVLQLLNATDGEGRGRPRFTGADQALLSHFASVATVAIERTQLTESIITRMLRMTETRDPIETGQHINRVAGISAALFEEWAHRRGLDGPAFERQRDRLRIAARLHDVGKVGVSDTILKKTQKLDAQEYEMVKRHVLIGARFFLDQPTEFDESSREVALNHHERWDGMGYPGHVDLDGRPLIDPVTRQPRLGGKRGEDIPLFARVVSLADVFDALSNRRCYKEAWPERRVLDTIRGESGRHFDPELVEIFFAKLPAIRDIRLMHPDE
jgi:response regulator RpfG family c-di-GMP phosphodiesterase